MRFSIISYEAIGGDTAKFFDKIILIFAIDEISVIIKMVVIHVIYGNVLEDSALM